MKQFLRLAVIFIIVLSISCIAVLSANTADLQFNNDYVTSIVKSTSSKSNENDVLSSAMMLDITNAQGGVAIKWNAIPNAKLYIVETKEENSKSWIEFARTTISEAIHKEAKSGKAYYYRVVALDKDNNECASISLPSANKFIAAPVLSSASVTENGIDIKWQKVEEAFAYRVMYKASNSTEWNQLTDTDKCEYIQTQFKKGIEYTYTVYVIDEKQNIVSGCDNAGIKTTYLAQPKISNLSLAAGGIKIDWAEVKGAQCYRVFLKNKNNWKIIGTTEENSLTHKKLNNAKDYTYTVRCISSDKKSYTSTFDETGMTKKYYSEPKLVKLDFSPKGPSLSWNSVEGASKYQVFYKLDNEKNWKTEKGMIVKSTSFVDTKAEFGHKYTYTVKCLNDKDEYISFHNPKGLSITYLETPNVRATLSDGAITISWDKVDKAYAYRVFKKNTTDEKFTILEDTKDTSYIYYPESSDFSYQFTVRCIEKGSGKYASSYQIMSSITSYMYTTKKEDPNYNPKPIKLDDKNRDLLERLCMGEASVYGYSGMALVAQCVRDTYVKDGYSNIADIIKDYLYEGSTDEPGNADAKAAVRFIFDEGGAAVKHRIIYFYATAICSSEFHETQNYICSCEDTRFFDAW